MRGRGQHDASGHQDLNALVAAGVVVGFPLLTSLALHEVPAAHAIVTIGLLPAATAVAAVLRAGERPAPSFWLASGAGSAAVVAFAVVGGATGLAPADVLLLAAVAVCGIGYAEGAVVARALGGARTICWALVLALPFTVPVAALSAGGLHAGPTAWLAFAYVAFASMFPRLLRLVRGLARGGVARIGQVQFAQPVLSLGWAALVLGETISPLEVVTAAVVLACVVATQRTRGGGVAPRVAPGFRPGQPGMRSRAAPEPRGEQVPTARARVASRADPQAAAPTPPGVPPGASGARAGDVVTEEHPVAGDDQPADAHELKRPAMPEREARVRRPGDPPARRSRAHEPERELRRPLDRVDEPIGAEGP